MLDRNLHHLTSHTVPLHSIKQITITKFNNQRSSEAKLTYDTGLKLFLDTKRVKYSV